MTTMTQMLAGIAVMLSLVPAAAAAPDVWWVLWKQKTAVDTLYPIGAFETRDACLATARVVYERMTQRQVAELGYKAGYADRDSLGQREAGNPIVPDAKLVFQTQCWPAGVTPTR